MTYTIEDREKNIISEHNTRDEAREAARRHLRRYYADDHMSIWHRIFDDNPEVDVLCVTSYGQVHEGTFIWVVPND